MTEDDQVAIVLYDAYLQISTNTLVREASIDGDNDSCEIIFTMKNGKTYIVKAVEDK